MTIANPQNLIVLTDLRRAAGFTLSDMAQRCGLTGRRSYQTAGHWERGQLIPAEKRRRTRFIGYLWDNLNLRSDPAQFEAVWTILVTEWGWAPIDDAEWSTFTSVPRPGQASQLPHPAQRHAPYQAPAPPHTFTGRDDLLESLCRHLTADTPRPLALVGMGGIGKSALAATMATQLRTHFTDGILWAQVAESQPLDILNAWAAGCGQDYRTLATVASKAAALRGLLDGKRILLVLDDVIDAGTVRSLFPAQPGPALLLTTRSEDVAVALGCTVQRLPELSVSASLDLLARLAGRARVAAQRDAAESLGRQLHHLPLAVEIAGQLLAVRPRLTVAALTEQLKDARNRLDLSMADRAVRSAFLSSWQALDADEQETFAHLALFQGRSFAAPTLAALLDLDPDLAEARLGALAARSLLSLEAGDHYRQHPLLADFAREQLGDAPAAWQRLAAVYLALVQQNARDLERLAPEWNNIQAAMHAAFTHEHWPTVLAFADALAGPWVAVGLYSQARQGCGWAMAAARALGDRLALAANQLRAASACIEQADYAEALSLLEAGRTLAATPPHPHLLAQAESLLARIALEQGRLDQAERRLTAAVEIHEELDDGPGLALAHHLRAFVAYRRGDLATARARCQAALALLDAEPPAHGEEADAGAGAAIPLGAIRALRLLADIAIEEGDYARAEASARRSLDLAQASPFVDELVENEFTLAVICRYLGRYPEALARIETAAAAYERTGKRVQRSHTLYERSVILRQMGDLADAASTARRSLALLEEGEDDYSRVFYLLNLAGIQAQAGDRAGAAALLAQAEALAAPLDHPRLPLIHARIRALTDDR